MINFKDVTVGDLIKLLSKLNPELPIKLKDANVQISSKKDTTEIVSISQTMSYTSVVGEPESVVTIIFDKAKDEEEEKGYTL